MQQNTLTTMSKINKPTAGDYTFALTKSRLGAILIVGSIASELLQLLVTLSLENDVKIG